jgi:hypothetical protein
MLHLPEKGWVQYVPNCFCLRHSQDKGLKRGKGKSTKESIGNKEGEGGDT